VTLRAIFYDEDDARAVATSLADAGFESVVARDRLSGEDDDEDHPWGVVTEAPEVVVDVLVEEHDGWLDAEEPPGPATPPAVPPLELPDAPRRVKGHFRRD
jgi:hypothetical protein